MFPTSPTSESNTRCVASPDHRLRGRGPSPSRPSGSWRRWVVPCLVALLLAAVACGGSDSPTNPEVPAEEFEGTWFGSMNGEIDDRDFSCALELELTDPDDNREEAVGTWFLDCLDERSGGGTVVVEGFFGFTTIEADGGDALGGCDWTARAFSNNEVTRLDGAWLPDDDCDADIEGGDLELRRVR